MTPGDPLATGAQRLEIPDAPHQGDLLRCQPEVLRPKDQGAVGRVGLQGRACLEIREQAGGALVPLSRILGQQLVHDRRQQRADPLGDLAQAGGGGRRVLL